MSASSATDRPWEGLRYVNIDCNCGIRALIRIAESPKNRGRLYYACANDVCTWLGWCAPITGFDLYGSQTMDSNAVESRGMVPVIETHNNMEEVRREVQKVVREVQRLRDETILVKSEIKDMKHMVFGFLIFSEFVVMLMAVYVVMCGKQ